MGSVSSGKYGGGTCGHGHDWASSLVRTVLLIQWVSYTREFQAVEMCHFPLPGVGDGLDTIGHIANPSRHNVMSLP